MSDAFFNLLETLGEHVSIMTMAASTEAVLEAIREFVAAARDPFVCEPGHAPIALAAGCHAVGYENGRLMVQAWNREQNLVRRVTGIAARSGGRMELTIEKFGKRTGTLLLIDRAHPGSETVTRRAARAVFRDWFHRMLLRQYPGWKVAELSSDPDLEHSLSPAYPRAFLRKGGTGLAAIGAPEEGSDPDGALAAGLIWLDYLRAREARIVIEGLIAVLPERRERTTCLRMQHLDAAAASYTVFAYGDGFEQAVDLADAGNLDTLLPVRESRFDVPEWMESAGSLPGVERIDYAADHISWRVRGYEFAKWNGREIRYGLESRRLAKPSHSREIEALAASLEQMRSANPENAGSPLYSAYPERWLESQIRAAIGELDASLLPKPVYGQVPAFAASDRAVLDLLAVSGDGRLAVIEVKASEDMQLPLQALDYWMRVRWHAAANEFGPKGYFRGIALRPSPPRLLLVAPALQFHPTTQTILRYFAPEIEVERFGLGMGWRSRLKVVFRARGASAVDECDHSTEDTNGQSRTSAEPGQGRDCTPEPARSP